MGAARPFVAPFIALRGRAFGSIALVIAVFGFAKNPALPVIALIIFVALAMIDRLSTQNRRFLFMRRRIVESVGLDQKARLRLNSPGQNTWPYLLNSSASINCERCR